MNPCPEPSKLVSPTPARLPPLYIRKGLALASATVGVSLSPTYMLIQFIESHYNNCYNSIGFGGFGQMGVPALLDVLKRYPSLRRYVTDPPRAGENQLAYWRREVWSTDLVASSAVGFVYLYMCQLEMNKVFGRQTPPSYAYARYQVGFCWNADGTLKSTAPCPRNMRKQATPFKKVRDIEGFRRVCNNLINGQ